MYIDSTNDMKPDGDTTVAADLQEAFADLLAEYGVDVTLHGHHHSYQRTCPLRDNKCAGFDNSGVARGPVHLVIGNAGAGLCLNVHKQLPEVSSYPCFCSDLSWVQMLMCCVCTSECHCATVRHMYISQAFWCFGLELVSENHGQNACMVACMMKQKKGVYIL